MKGIFSLEWFIKKYGESEGLVKYEERNTSISKTSYFRIFNKTNRKNYSKKSQKLFWELYNNLCLQNQKIYFGDINDPISSLPDHLLPLLFPYLDYMKRIENCNYFFSLIFQ